MRRSQTAPNLGAYGGVSSLQTIPEPTNYAAYKEKYSEKLSEILGCCLADVEQNIANLPMEEVSKILKAFSSLFIVTQPIDRRKKIEASNVILNLMKECFPLLFQSIAPHDDQDISAITPIPNTQDIAYTLTKIPRIYYIIYALKESSNNHELNIIIHSIFAAAVKHMILPEKIRTALNGVSEALNGVSEASNSLQTLTDLMQAEDIPTSRPLETMFFWRCYQEIDNFAYFKQTHLNKTVILTPLIGSEDAGIFYTSLSSDLENKGLLNYVDFFPYKQNVVAISAHELDVSEYYREQSILEISTLDRIEILYSISQISSQSTNFLDSFVKRNSTFLADAVIIKSKITSGDQSIYLYQLPHINDAFYGHPIVQKLIAEYLVLINDDINSCDLEHAPITINCERGQNRSKAIYEAMIEFKYPHTNPAFTRLRTQALESSLPENMSHFDKMNLSEYKYLGFDEAGNRINPIAGIIRDKVTLSHPLEQLEQTESLAFSERVNDSIIDDIVNHIPFSNIAEKQISVSMLR